MANVREGKNESGIRRGPHLDSRKYTCSMFQVTQVLAQLSLILFHVQCVYCHSCIVMRKYTEITCKAAFVSQKNAKIQARKITGQKLNRHAPFLRKSERQAFQFPGSTEAIRLQFQCRWLRHLCCCPIPEAVLPSPA